MAYQGYRTQQDSFLKRNRWTIIVLVFCLALAGTVRIAFNYEPAINDGTYRYAGNDDYYHLRVVQHVQETGEHLVDDPLLNYPVPAKNPRPPVYDWSVAIMAQGIAAVTPMDSVEAGQYALEWGSALWGMLIVIPTWLLGRALFSNTAGLWAAFLIAASPSNIQRSGFGLGDHDAFILFFLVLGAYFIVRALKYTRSERFVQTWTNPTSVGEGFAEYVRHHPRGLAYSFLAGVSFATIALMWEGFPYALAVYAIYYFIQVLVNQFRNRDSTGDLLNMLVLMGTILVMALPFYWMHGNVRSTVTASIYIIAGLLVLSYVLVATRDLPWLIVVPSLAGVGLVGLFLVTVVFPDIGRQLFTANGYFVQDRLYSTIAEAQRTDLGVFVFSVGFMTFFFALVGVGFLVALIVKHWDRSHIFLLGWSVVALYMAFAASRFVYNATPVLAVLGGWVVAKFVGWMDMRQASRDFKSLRHDGIGRATRATMTPKVVFGVLVLVLTLIIPNLWFSVDAGIPGEFRSQALREDRFQRDLVENRTGAFGQGFLGPNWINVYGWLAERDHEDFDGDPLAPEDRPAHAAWWDYGFWEVALGHHPTVADNFQNGYQVTGRMIAAQDEQEMVEWMTIRLLEGDKKQAPFGYSDAVRTYLDDFRPGFAAQTEPLATVSGYDELQVLLRNTTTGLEETIELYEGVKAASGTNIGYFLVDDRMLPFDDPRTPNIDSGSIFYAPVFLANKNPDDFVQTVYVAGGNEYFVESYGVDEGGEVFQLEQPKIVDPTGRQYFASGGQLFRATPDGDRIDYGFNQGVGLSIQSVRLEFHQAFYETMFYKAFVGGERPIQGNLPGAFNPGQDLAHFRLVKQAGDPFGVKLLEYYPGAVVTGRVVDETGAPVTDAEVFAVDDLGISHHSNTTGADGSYRVLAPFGMEDDNGTVLPTRIEVRQAGQPLASANVTVSRAAAMRHGDYNLTTDVEIRTGTVEGFAYLDRNHNGAFDNETDEPAAGLTAELVDGASTTTGADGRFTLTNVQPGTYQVRVSGADGYDNATRSVNVQSDGTATVDLGLTVSRVAVSGSITGPDEAPIPAYRVNFTAVQPSVDYAQNATTSADAAGDFSTQLFPGEYTARVQHDGTVYTTSFTLAVGQDPVALPASEWTRSSA